MITETAAAQSGRDPLSAYALAPDLAPRHAGVLLAIAAAQQAVAPGIMCLRGVNPYVDAALADWSRRGGGAAPVLARMAAPAPALPEVDSLAGEPSERWHMLWMLAEVQL